MLPKPLPFLFHGQIPGGTHQILSLHPFPAWAAPQTKQSLLLILPDSQSLHSHCTGHGNFSLCHVVNRRLMQAHYVAIIRSAKAAKAHFLVNCALSLQADEYSSHWHHSDCSGEEGLITGERVYRMWVNTLSLPLCLSSNTQSAIWLNFNPKQSSLKMKDLYRSIFACCN